MDYTVFYVAQESAMAPGIGDPWPMAIQNPKSKHGRLQRLPGATCRRIVRLLYEESADSGLLRGAVWEQVPQLGR